MVTSRIVFILTLCGLLTACASSENFLIEEDPVSNVINLDAHDFYITGDIDGEDFVIYHTDHTQYNEPVNDDRATSGVPFFGTSFIIRLPGEPSRTNILFGLTESGSSRFENVVKVGTYGWFNHSYPNQSVGEALINQLNFNDLYMTNSTIPQSNPDNYFEITSITPLELDENLSDIYAGKLYKVEGHFAIDLDKWDNSGEVPRLTVDYFSAIFYDNS
jgi:hypothetical protein